MYLLETVNVLEVVIDEAEPPMPKPFHSLSHPVGAAVNEPML